MKAIELKKVSFSYDGKNNILLNADYSVDYGEVCLLSGHSGEGKSTLMYIISGIIPNVNYGQLSGEVLINGERPLRFAHPLLPFPLRRQRHDPQ